jgi:hypothetical protein
MRTEALVAGSVALYLSLFGRKRHRPQYQQSFAATKKTILPPVSHFCKPGSTIRTRDKTRLLEKTRNGHRHHQHHAELT